MLRKIIGYVLILIGFLCFLVVGGGSMRYRNRSVNMHNSLSEDVVLIVLLILTPVIGFFLIKIGFRILGNDKK